MKKYTKTAMALHWLIAILIIIAFQLGQTMVDIPGITPTKLKYFSWHKWLGVTVLALVAIRLLWRLKNPAPPYPNSMPGWQKMASSSLHGLLYVLMFAIPVSGYLYSSAAGIPVVYLGYVPLPTLIDPNPELKVVLKSTHIILNKVLLAAFILHVTAALKHLIIDRDGIFKRMLP